MLSCGNVMEDLEYRKIKLLMLSKVARLAKNWLKDAAIFRL
ncbi:hypothetical protein SAMN02746095_02135 [Acidocella aminolytica 101 = DSM 11237]|jgi:hypothetical protein|nr:hypothetical protein SAMN02746095_02135 [Acidocella aminolytica 101 = DSM 11237]